MARQTGKRGERRGGPTPPGMIGAGTPVYDVAGKKLGTVIAARPEEGYLEMRRGLVLHRTLYVPLGAVEQTGPHAIYLRCPKGDVRHQGWERPPFGPTLVYEGPARQDSTEQKHRDYQEEER